ncbi:DUF1146 family protein [Caldalkalibacillus mannanilyticus]|uniref:DUF1146 family protein n=1 Tax=Caldalkalibacillus mannanilyticus TaxID=1418 RepID=UPI00046848FA|nr:DUF1146 family protein [Caldalkalibacillus mannanilyticus]
MLEATLGVNAIISMLLSIFFIGVSWWALQAFKFDLFIRNKNGTQAKLLQLIIAIVLGYGVTSFFMDYLKWSALLKYIFY